MVKKPEPAFWLESPSIAACEIAQLVGYGIVVIDMEHGTTDTKTCDNIVAFCRALKLTCYVRVAAADRLLIQQALDYGASGVMLPQITDAAHAAEVSAYAKYPPLGSRGLPVPGEAAYLLAAEEGAGYVTVSDDLTALRTGFAKGLEVARDERAVS